MAWRKTIIRFGYFLLVVLMVFAVSAFLRPIPPVNGTVTYKIPATSTNVDLPWPTSNQSAIGAVGYGVLGTAGSKNSAPTASVAKIITALAVLKEKPLLPGQSGPTLTLDATDVAFHDKYVAEDGSVVPVAVGEQITQYQVLQAMMLPSANNMADSLARWAFGSTDAYVTYANSWLKSLGLNKTTVADASGFNPQTVSSAHDLVVLGEMVMGNPALANIVNQKTAVIPLAGTINNTNFLLGTNGVIGIKTGNTDQAGGCYLFASQQTIAGQPITLVGVIMGAPDRDGAIKATPPLISAATSGFELAHYGGSDQNVGYYKTPWGSVVKAVAAKDPGLLIWKGSKPEIAVNLQPVTAPAAKGAALGSLKIIVNQKQETVPVVLAANLDTPPLSWRLLH